MNSGKSAGCANTTPILPNKPPIISYKLLKASCRKARCFFHCVYEIFRKNSGRKNETLDKSRVSGYMVEIRGIEPLSENHSTGLSTSVVYLLKFPPRDADKQAARFGSFIIQHAGQNLAAAVHH